MFEIWKSVKKGLESGVHHVRKLAAEASVALIPYIRLVGFVEEVLGILANRKIGNNLCQGLCLQVNIYLKKSPIINKLSFLKCDHLLQRNITLIIIISEIFPVEICITKAEIRNNL